MTTFALTDRVVADPGQRRNNEDLLRGLNQLGQFLFFGTGVPTFTPTDIRGVTTRALFVRLDGGAGTSLYVYEGAGWAAK